MDVLALARVDAVDAVVLAKKVVLQVALVAVKELVLEEHDNPNHEIHSASNTNSRLSVFFNPSNQYIWKTKT